MSRLKESKKFLGYFIRLKKIIIIDHGTKNKSGNKLEKKKKVERAE